MKKKIVGVMVFLLFFIFSSFRVLPQRQSNTTQDGMSIAFANNIKDMPDSAIEGHNHMLEYSESMIPIATYSDPELSRIVFMTTIVFLFYFVPMLVMLILFICRKEKKGLKLFYLHKFLSYTLSFFGLFLLSKVDLTPAIVLLCGYGILTLIALYQNIVNNCRDFNSLIAETVCWAMNIYYFIVHDIESIYINIWIFGLLDFIFALLRIRKTAKMDPTLKNSLPVGILYSLEGWLIYLYFSITLSTFFIISEALNHFEIFVVAALCIFLIYIVGMILRQGFFFLKPFREFYKDLNLDALENKIQKRQTLPHLHPETINFYNILLAQQCLAHDMEKTKKYIKKAYLPKTNRYILSYRGMNMRYGQSKEEFEHGYEVLKREYYNNKAMLKSFDKFYKFWLPYYGTNPNQNIEKVYKYHRKNNEFSNAISLFVLIHYYKNENDISKVEELKKEFISKYGVLTEFVKDLNKL
ncbi:MAG: hypothetical protein NC310_06540 [Roseburia sp.]|nr:hypothetical protein [Anaeroplasma bactoclasticum]MCM1196706.1 hypothetical protein [Roseburia sp.]MCM1557734.1 hypothetical protein [Anaeroplasma bactoclasticum]